MDPSSLRLLLVRLLLVTTIKKATNTPAFLSERQRQRVVSCLQGAHESDQQRDVESRDLWGLGGLL